MKELLEDFADGIATLTLNRPEAMNALTPDMLDRLAELLHTLAEDRSCRVVVLTGAGRGFCAGGDLKAASTAPKATATSASEPPWRRLRDRMEAARLLHEMPQPTIAALPGSAAGAGMSLALACDLRIAVKGARLVPAFGRVGLSGDFGGSYFLARLIGQARARACYYLSEPLTVEEALALGAVYQVVEEADQLAPAVRELAGRLARGPAVALAYMKSNFNLAESAALSECLDQEARHHNMTTRTRDHQEGARAFVEKRPPEFTGE